MVQQNQIELMSMILQSTFGTKTRQHRTHNRAAQLIVKRPQFRLKRPCDLISK